MTILPVADSARLLGIHSKTLHHWLKEANVPLATHPTDARMKCVAEEHLQQVARLHDRPLPSAASSPPLNTASAPLVAPQPIVRPARINEVEPASTACSPPAPYAPEGGPDPETDLPGNQGRDASRAARPTRADVAPGTGAIGRASDHGPGVPHAATAGKADARSASSRG